MVNVEDCSHFQGQERGQTYCGSVFIALHSPALPGPNPVRTGDLMNGAPDRSQSLRPLCLVFAGIGDLRTGLYGLNIVGNPVGSAYYKMPEAGNEYRPRKSAEKISGYSFGSYGAKATSADEIACGAVKYSQESL